MARGEQKMKGLFRPARIPKHQAVLDRFSYTINPTPDFGSPWCISSDGLWFIGVIGNQLGFWRMDDGKLQATLHLSRELGIDESSGTFSLILQSPDGHYLAIGVGSKIYFFETKSRALVSSMNHSFSEFGKDVAFLPDSEIFVSVDRSDLRIRHFDIFTGEEVRISDDSIASDVEGFVLESSISVSADSSLIATTAVSDYDGGSVKLWDARSLAFVERIDALHGIGKGKSIGQARFGMGSNVLATCPDRWSMESSDAVMLWFVDPPKTLPHVIYPTSGLEGQKAFMNDPVTSDPISDLCFSPDGGWFAYTDRDTIILCLTPDIPRSPTDRFNMPVVDTRRLILKGYSIGGTAHPIAVDFSRGREALVICADHETRVWPLCHDELLSCGLYIRLDNNTDRAASFEGEDLSNE